MARQRVETGGRGGRAGVRDAGEERPSAAPLRGCGRRLAQIGEPPALLQDVKEAAILACGEAEIALAKNQEFGMAAYQRCGSTLAEVEDKLRGAQRSLELALNGPV